jgi:hypothetical protein
MAMVRSKNAVGSLEKGAATATATNFPSLGSTFVVPFLSEKQLQNARLGAVERF